MRASLAIPPTDCRYMTRGVSANDYLINSYTGRAFVLIADWVILRPITPGGGTSTVSHPVNKHSQYEEFNLKQTTFHPNCLLRVGKEEVNAATP